MEDMTNIFKNVMIDVNFINKIVFTLTCIMSEQNNSLINKRP